MIQLPRRAVALPLIIHRRQYLKTRSSFKLLPDSATYVTRLWRGLSRRAYEVKQTLYHEIYCKLCSVAT